MPATAVIPTCSRRCILAVAVTAVAAVLAGAPADVAAQLQLDVMTFNIRTSYIPDGENAWAKRKELVAETIRRYAPDVIGMQEAITEQIDYLTDVMPEYRWLGVDRRLNGGAGLSEHTPIFYRHEKLAPIESGNFWLTDTPDRPPPPANGQRRRRGGGRIVTWARFHHLASGHALYVFNTHLSLRRGDGQIDSMQLILERAGVAPEGSAVILLVTSTTSPSTATCGAPLPRAASTTRGSSPTSGSAPRSRGASSGPRRSGGTSGSTGSWSADRSRCAPPRRSCTTKRVGTRPTTTR